MGVAQQGAGNTPHTARQTPFLSFCTWGGGEGGGGKGMKRMRQDGGFFAFRQ